MRVRGHRGSRLIVLMLAAWALGCSDDDAGGTGDAGREGDGAMNGGLRGDGGGNVGPHDGGGSAADGGGAPGGNRDGGRGDGGSAEDGGKDGGGVDAGPIEPCGDGVVDEDESCDTGIASGTGKCPASCDDDDACTTDVLSGAGTCEAECSHVEITAAEDGDECCPAGTTGTDDDDCPPTRLDVIVGPEDVSTELGTEHTLTVTLEASEGFAGNVQLAASVVDGSNAALSSWTVELDATEVTVAKDGTATAHVTVTIPSVREVLAATVKVVATSDAMSGAFEASASFDLLDRVSIEVPVVGGQCVYPPSGTLQVKNGTTIRWLNVSAGPTDNLTIHVNPNPFGCQHQPDPGSPPGSAYECTIADGVVDPDPFLWYCHAPGPSVNDRALAVVP